MSFDNATTCENLAEYLGAEREAGRPIPYTMNVFYNGYVNYLVVRHIHRYGSGDVPRYYAWNVRQAMDNMSKLAYVDYVGGRARLTGEVIIKLFGKSAETDDGKHGEHTEDWIEYCTFGFLTAVRRRSVRKTRFCFQESCVREYFVAHFLLLEFLRKVQRNVGVGDGDGDNDKIQNIKNVMSHATQEILRRLPATGDIWRMVFGLMSKDKVQLKLSISWLNCLINFQTTTLTPILPSPGSLLNASKIACLPYNM